MRACRSIAGASRTSSAGVSRAPARLAMVPPVATSRTRGSACAVATGGRRGQSRAAGESCQKEEEEAGDAPSRPDHGTPVPDGRLLGLPVRQRQPVGEPGHGQIGGDGVERHEGGRPAVGVEHVGPPALESDLRDFDAIVAAMDALDEPLGRWWSRRSNPVLAKRYSSDRTAAIKRTKDRSSSTAPEAADRLARHADLFFASADVCTGVPPVVHTFSTIARRQPSGGPRRRRRRGRRCVAPHAPRRRGGRTRRRVAGIDISPVSARRIVGGDDRRVRPDRRSCGRHDRFGRSPDHDDGAGVEGRLGAHGSLYRVGTGRPLRRDPRRSRLRGDERDRGAHVERRRGHARSGRAARARRAGPPPARRLAARSLRISRRGSAADAGPARRGDRRLARRLRPDGVRRRLRRQRPAAGAGAGAAAADPAGLDRAGAAAVAARRCAAPSGRRWPRTRARRSPPRPPRRGSPRRDSGPIA